MHIVSDKSLYRPGYIYNKHGVGYPEGGQPYINWKHIDGPLLYARNGQLHWLTLWERFCFWVCVDDIYSIERKRFPDTAPCTVCGTRHGPQQECDLR